MSACPPTAALVPGAAVGSAVLGGLGQSCQSQGPCPAAAAGGCAKAEAPLLSHELFGQLSSPPASSSSISPNGLVSPASLPLCVVLYPEVFGAVLPCSWEMLGLLEGLCLLCIGPSCAASSVFPWRSGTLPRAQFRIQTHLCCYAAVAWFRGVWWG